MLDCLTDACRVVVQHKDSPKVQAPGSVVHSTPVAAAENHEQVCDASMDYQEENSEAWKDNLMNLASVVQNQTVKGPINLVAGAQVFSRNQKKQSKKQSNFSFSKAEQLSTKATHKSFIFKVFRNDILTYYALHFETDFLNLVLINQRNKIRLFL